jgi:hypothetical protein
MPASVKSVSRNMNYGYGQRADTMLPTITLQKKRMMHSSLQNMMMKQNDITPSARPVLQWLLVLF